MSPWLALVIAYLAGAVPTAYLAGRAHGIDLREHGSKNLGATNLYRVLGLKVAVPVALFDILKGALPVMLLSGRLHTPLLSPEWTPLVIGAAAILGHVFPVYMGFKGGKGVATAAGVMIGAAPLPFAASALVWGVLLGFVRVMSLASIAGAVTFPVAVWLTVGTGTPVFWMGVIIATFIVFTHRANVKRLVEGTEPKLGRPKPSAGEA